MKIRFKPVRVSSFQSAFSKRFTNPSSFLTLIHSIFTYSLRTLAKCYFQRRNEHFFPSKFVYNFC